MEEPENGETFMRLEASIVQMKVNMRRKASKHTSPDVLPVASPKDLTRQEAIHVLEF